MREKGTLTQATSAPATSPNGRSGAEKGVGSCGEVFYFKVVQDQVQGGDLGSSG